MFACPMYHDELSFRYPLYALWQFLRKKTIENQ